MSYIGAKELKASDIRRFDVTGSTSATHTLTWTAPTEQSLIVTINGVKQQEDAYSVSGTTLTLTSALVSTDKLEVIGINDIGTTITPAQNSVTADTIADGVITNAKINASAAIAQSKLSLDITNSEVNASAAIALSKLATDPSNASNLASGTVPTARLGSGTASSSTFLRGDQSWATAGADNTPAFQMTNTANQTFSAGSYGTLDFNQTNWDTDSGCDLTNNKYVVPSGEGGKYFIYGYFAPTSLSGSSVYLRIKVNTTEVTLWNATAGNSGHHRHPVFIVYDLAAGDEIIWQLYVDNVSTTTGAQSGGGFKLAGV